MWQVAGEPVMFLGGQRALLLQLSHPMVAAGVEHHSSFRSQPVRRLWATLDALICLVWGHPEEARRARGRILGIHDGVHGSLSPTESAGARWPTGAPYTAHDPALLWWVWATLVDTAEVVHHRFLRPLDPPEQLALYDDWLRLAQFVGIPDSFLDAQLGDFRVRFVDELDALQISPAARDLAASVLNPPLWFAPPSLKRAYALIATSLSHPVTRRRFELPWGPSEQAAAATIEDRVRRSWELTPEARRDLPLAYLAVRRPALAGATRVAASAGAVRDRLSVAVRRSALSPGPAPIGAAS